MKIVTVPHSALRRETRTVSAHTKKLPSFIKELVETLDRKRNPRGVGLAAPQVDQNWQIFTTLIPTPGASEDAPPQPRVFVNPEIANHSQKVTFGPDKDSPILEGCLSIPEVYGPVPRWEWVEMLFEEWIDGQLVRKTEHFAGFPARVMQHEYDHLQGVLFTDYSLQYDLPVYKDRSKKLEEIDKRILEAF